ncbi:ATP-binding protein [Paenibacillus sp. FSL K6-2393]|uniref:ATP-binding protein n=1 Tax=Paenibacillus sp. FSL K6-2393 TaxID=2921475 RepID=UPI0030FC4B4A
MKKIVFVGGIHGVGKTYLCNEINQELDTPHFSASELIRKQKEEEARTVKNVTDVKGNQDALIMAINNYVTDIPIFLLDGHFCILNKEGEIERIPHDTFERMEIACLLVLTDDPNEIHMRLKNRDSREYPIDLLDKFQTEELSYAKQLSETLMLPLLVHKNGEDKKKLYDFLNKHI